MNNTFLSMLHPSPHSPTISSSSFSLSPASSCPNANNNSSSSNANQQQQLLLLLSSLLEPTMAQQHSLPLPLVGHHNQQQQQMALAAEAAASVDDELLEQQLRAVCSSLMLPPSTSPAVVCPSTPVPIQPVWPTPSTPPLPAPLLCHLLSLTATALGNNNNQKHVESLLWHAQEEAAMPQHDEKPASTISAANVLNSGASNCLPFFLQHSPNKSSPPQLASAPHFHSLPQSQPPLTAFANQQQQQTLLPICSTPNFHPGLLLCCSSPTSSPTSAAIFSTQRPSLQFGFNNCYAPLLFPPAPFIVSNHQQNLPFLASSDTTSAGSINSISSRNDESKGIDRQQIASATISESANSINGTSSRAHRLSYPREFKLIVLHSYWANGQNKYRTCKEFQITKSMLNGWLLKADKIRSSRPGSLKSGRSGRRPQFPEIERKLFEMLRAKCVKGQHVSNKWIRETAKRLAELEVLNNNNSQERKKQKKRTKKKRDDLMDDLAIAEKDGLTGGVESAAMMAQQQQQQCQFSERWLNNFKRRFGIQGWPTAAGADDDTTKQQQFGGDGNFVVGMGINEQEEEEEEEKEVQRKEEENAMMVETDFFEQSDADNVEMANNNKWQRHQRQCSLSSMLSFDEGGGGARVEEMMHSSPLLALANAAEQEQWTRIGRELCLSTTGTGQLPIQAFYARFPKILMDAQQ